MLLAGARRVLERAGFDPAPAADMQGDAVMAAWEPGAGLDPARHDSVHAGMRMALLHVLTTVLGQTGYVVQADGETGEVQVRSAAP
ncbi:hypothetical protein [Streptomyces sp. NPDC048419]|uniref:hypothetical protein n=1 Tax=Streptomyces sp. NPDC048419 TaxID=3365547 RepID=UPI0037154241